MTFSSPYRFGPGATPSTIKSLILITCCISIFSALTDGLFNYFFKTSGPQDWLSLSWYGIVRHFYWQPFTYMFVQYSGFDGITFFYILSLFLNMYLLWILGCIVIEKIESFAFLKLYFFSGITAGLLGLIVMPLGGYTVLTGITPSLLALLVVWTFYNPDAELLLFFLIPAKIKWLTIGILGATSLITLSQLDIVHFVFYLSGALYGYFYILLVWNLDGPFPLLHPLEHTVNQIGISLRRLWKGNKNKGEKIIPFPERNMNDDQFVDAMLAKISRHGESSLSWSERRRMEEISKKRLKK